MGKFRPAQRLSSAAQSWRFMSFGYTGKLEPSAMGLVGEEGIGANVESWGAPDL
jgi:hypothetical protein